MKFTQIATPSNVTTPLPRYTDLRMTGPLPQNKRNQDPNPFNRMGTGFTGKPWNAVPQKMPHSSAPPGPIATPSNVTTPLPRYTDLRMTGPLPQNKRNQDPNPFNRMGTGFTGKPWNAVPQKTPHSSVPPSPRSPITTPSNITTLLPRYTDLRMTGSLLQNKRNQDPNPFHRMGTGSTEKPGNAVPQKVLYSSVSITARPLKRRKVGDPPAFRSVRNLGMCILSRPPLCDTAKT
jgi:hypothetical protein